MYADSYSAVTRSRPSAMDHAEAHEERTIIPHSYDVLRRCSVSHNITE